MPPKKIFPDDEELDIPIFDDPKKIEKMVKTTKKPKSAKPKIPKKKEVSGTNVMRK